MTIRHLKVFIAVAESGKMNIAAKNLYLSQPTVSQVIKELEEHYGVLLFERLSKRLYITGGKADARLRAEGGGRLSGFGIPYAAGAKPGKAPGRRFSHSGSCRMPEMLRRFKQMYPGIATYVCRQYGSSGTEAAGCGAGRRGGGGEDPQAGAYFAPLETDELVVFCGAAHPLAHKASVGLKELASADFVMREQEAERGNCLRNL